MIASLFADWRTVLTRPSVQTFDAQKPYASKERTLTGVVIAAVVSAVLGAILAAIFVSFTRTISPIAGLQFAVPSTLMIFVSTLVRTLIQTIVGFYLFCYILQYVATRFFGGTGEAQQQAYLISTFWVPISILSQVLMFIPCIGQLIALALVVYALVLTTFAVQSGQGVAVGNAVITWIISAVATAIVIGVVFAILSGLAGGWL